MSQTVIEGTQTVIFRKRKLGHTGNATCYISCNLNSGPNGVQSQQTQRYSGFQNWSQLGRVVSVHIGSVHPVITLDRTGLWLSGINVKVWMLLVPWRRGSRTPFMTPSGRNRHWKTAWSAPPVLMTHCRSLDQRTFVTWAEWPMYFLNLAPVEEEETKISSRQRTRDSLMAVEVWISNLSTTNF